MRLRREVPRARARLDEIHAAPIALIDVASEGSPGSRSARRMGRVRTVPAIMPPYCSSIRRGIRVGAATHRIRHEGMMNVCIAGAGMTRFGKRDQGLLD